MTDAIGSKALENGWKVEWGWSDWAESPRDGELNLGHMLTWARGFNSPDDNPWADPVDFVADMLCERFTFAELHDAVSAGRLGSLRFETGGDGEERLLVWYRSMITGRTGWDEVEDYSDYRDRETLARAIAECAEAPGLLQEKVVLKTVYMLEHSGVAYSTGSFGDPWDSGAVGFIWADDDDVSSWFGGVPTSREKVSKRLDFEVERYSDWANGEVYTVSLIEADGDVIEAVGGCIGDRDLELGIAEMEDIARAA